MIRGLKKIFKKRLPKDSDSVFIEVHQNGELLSRTERPFKKRGSVYLTSRPTGELTAPFYPLPSDIRILKITKRGVELDLDPNWEGFTTYEGKIENIDSDRKSAYTHIMKRGDYGSIAYNDLRVLIRIGRPHRKQANLRAFAKEYRPSFFEFWLGPDRVGLLWGAAAAGVMTLGFVYGLIKRPDDRPRQFIELRDEYTLPFIHPLHLSQGPETLQSEYNRVDPVSSAVGFAQSFAETVLDFPQRSTKKSKSPILMSARDARADRYDRAWQRYEELKAGFRERESKILADKRNALVAIPVIIGESSTGSLVRMHGLLRKWYQGTAQTLEIRRQTTASFKSDRAYDFQEYRNPDVGPGAPANFIPSGDEKNLYAEAGRFAARAEAIRTKIRKSRRPVTLLSADNGIPVGISEASPFTSFVRQDSFEAFNDKLERISASVFDPDKPKIAREPVIGSVDRKLVLQTIEKSRFELQLCYELALRRNQGAEGLMEWRWLLDTKGQVLDLELVQNTVNDLKMANCIREKIARWKWPRPHKGSIEISYPFYFKPSKG